MPNSTSALTDGQFREHQEGQEYKPNQNEVAHGVCRNWAWQLLTSVSSLTCCVLQSRGVLEPHLQLWHHNQKTDGPPPQPGSLLCCSKKQISSFILYRNSWLQVHGHLSCCGAFGHSPRRVQQGRPVEPHTPPSLVSQMAKEFGQFTLLPQCESLWLRQVPSNMIEAVKRSNCHGRVFLPLGCCFVLATFGNKKKKVCPFQVCIFLISWAFTFECTGNDVRVPLVRLLLFKVELTKRGKGLGKVLC